jgi:hypothetical protein
MVIFEVGLYPFSGPELIQFTGCGKIIMRRGRNETRPSASILPETETGGDGVCGVKEEAGA